jgi:hypothetical protein
LMGWWAADDTDMRPKSTNDSMAAAIPWLKQLLIALLQRPNPTSISVGFVMVRVVVRQGFLQGFRFSCYYPSTSDPYSFHSSTPNTMKY